MAKLKEPESMDEIIYFTRRKIDSGSAVAWVKKKSCPKCKKSKMGKPVEKGKIKIRAEVYVCPSCSYTEGKKEHEESLDAEINYTCQNCKNDDGIKIPFKRKRIQLINKETGKKKAAESLQFQCSKCSKDIDITKKMK